MSYKHWTNEEIEFLKNNHKSTTLKQISKKLGKPYMSVVNKSHRLKLKKYLNYKQKLWTDLEINTLLKFYKDLGYKEIGKMINRSKASVQGKARMLKIFRGYGYKRSEECIKNLKERNYRMVKEGKIKWFTKDNNPMNNKETKEKMRKKIIEMYASGKMKINSGTFKKGNIPIKHFEKGNIPHNKYKTKDNYEPLKRVSKKLKEARKKRVFPIKDTKIEVKIQNFLKELKIDFIPHKYVSEIKYGYQCDILIPSINLVIECDGDYWHGNLHVYKDWNNLNQKQKISKILDYERTNQLEEKGYNVIRLWESEIKQMNINDFQNKVIK